MMYPPGSGLTSEVSVNANKEAVLWEYGSPNESATVALLGNPFVTAVATIPDRYSSILLEICSCIVEDALVTIRLDASVVIVAGFE